MNVTKNNIECLNAKMLKEYVLLGKVKSLIDQEKFIAQNFPPT